MKQELRAVAQLCRDGAGAGSMTFPQILATLNAAGFDGYLVDYRGGTITYYLAAGGSVELALHPLTNAVADAFNATRMIAAIREAQQLAPGYTYRGFCEKAAMAGCAGYLVSRAGRRVLYFGRTGETHMELMPPA